MQRDDTVRGGEARLGTVEDGRKRVAEEKAPHGRKRIWRLRYVEASSEIIRYTTALAGFPCRNGGYVGDVDKCFVLGAKILDSAG